MWDCEKEKEIVLSRGKKMFVYDFIFFLSMRDFEQIRRIWGKWFS